MIRRLDAEGVSKAQIARRLGISRTTVTKAVASDRPPRYRRAPVETSFVSFESRVRALLKLTPDMPATVLAERVGWTGSITWFRQNVKRIRVDYLPVDPSDRLQWLAGDAAQCDLWFPPRRIGLEDASSRLLPVLVMTCAYSRFTLGQMIPTRKTEVSKTAGLAASYEQSEAPLPPRLNHRRCAEQGWRRNALPALQRASDCARSKPSARRAGDSCLCTAYTSSLYPSPRTVTRIEGSAGLGSIFDRNRFTCTSRVLVSPT